MNIDEKPAPVAYQEDGQVRISADDLLLDPEDAEQFAEHLRTVASATKHGTPK